MFSSMHLVDAKADEHDPEGVVIIAANLKIQQVVIIQNMVVDPLTGSALAVNELVRGTVSWHTRVETQVPIRFKVKGAP